MAFSPFSLARLLATLPFLWPGLSECQAASWPGRGLGSYFYHLECAWTIWCSNRRGWGVGAPDSGYSTRLGVRCQDCSLGQDRRSLAREIHICPVDNSPMCHQGRSFAFNRGSLLGRIYNEGHSHHLPFPPSRGHGLNPVGMLCGNSTSGPF